MSAFKIADVRWQHLIARGKVDVITIMNSKTAVAARRT
jgi:hypothetical protein